jgi:hypothetical protein
VLGRPQTNSLFCCVFFSLHCHSHAHPLPHPPPRRIWRGFCHLSYPVRVCSRLSSWLPPPTPPAHLVTSRGRTLNHHITLFVRDEIHLSIPRCLCWSTSELGPAVVGPPNRPPPTLPCFQSDPLVRLLRERARRRWRPGVRAAVMVTCSNSKACQTKNDQQQKRFCNTAGAPPPPLPPSQSPLARAGCLPSPKSLSAARGLCAMDTPPSTTASRRGRRVAAPADPLGDQLIFSRAPAPLPTHRSLFLLLLRLGSATTSALTRLGDRSGVETLVR